MKPIKSRQCLVAFLGLALPLLAYSTQPLLLYPQNQTLYDKFPHSLFYYYGVTVTDPLARMFTDMHRWPEHINSLEYSYTLSKYNPVRRFFCPLVGVVQLAMNITQRNGRNENTIYEFDPYITFRWANLPWNHLINTSFAIGEGISYASSYPSLEKKSNHNTKRLLNYLMLEVSIASPYYPRLQFVARIHHRSGAFGLYHAGNTGSNVIGAGVRYLFD